jgi:hypothetical protein
VIGGIATVAAAIEEDLRGRLPAQHKKQRAGLALLAATMLDVRSANLMDLAASLPRAAERLDMRYQWISRLLGNARIGIEAVMAPYVREVLARLAADGRRVVLMIDQSQASERHQVVMVAARIGGRALPLAWRVKATQGAIGFAEQRLVLEAVARLLPDGARPVLLGDRFHGTPDLIAWCRRHGWDWRLRLKRDLLVCQEGGETTLAACWAAGEHLLWDVELTAKRVATHIAMVHEPSHPEPWIIALSEAPTVHRAFDHGLRWGIEVVFTQMTKAHLFAADAERDDVADLDLAVGDQHAIDQQLDQLPLLREVGIGQARLNPPAEIRRRGGPAGKFGLPVDLGFQLVGLHGHGLQALLQRLASALVFRQRNDGEQVGFGQPLQLPFETALTLA